MADSTGGKTIEYLVKERKRPSFLVDILTRLVKTKPLGTIGGIIVLVLFFVGIFADVLAPYGMNEFILSDRLSPPSLSHLLGADNLGRDLLSRVIYGARISMIVSLGATTISKVGA
ncbi:MAG: ABC transporter permease, partial [bacterium]|nr:ABC transporter permease [bacterium]